MPQDVGGRPDERHHERQLRRPLHQPLQMPDDRPGLLLEHRPPREPIRLLREALPVITRPGEQFGHARLEAVPRQPFPLRLGVGQAVRFHVPRDGPEELIARIQRPPRPVQRVRAARPDDLQWPDPHGPELDPRHVQLPRFRRRQRLRQGRPVHPMPEREQRLREAALDAGHHARQLRGDLIEGCRPG